MTEDVYKPPESKVDSKKNGMPRQIRRPWIIYLMALWAFLGLGSFINTIIRMLGKESPEVLQFGGIVVLVFTIFMIINILSMNKIILVIFGILCAGLSLWQTVNIVRILSSEHQRDPVVYFLLYYVIPSAILAIVALRPGFLKLADEYRAFRKYEAMRKVSLKAIGK